ncbi:hypothetical protein RD792_008731 [Penstemon davidsonii]|uniref:SBP-type domain-containing protein n=1 Tax=Penstemon davidsonii TaxID=160366 RepID=A0ABR0DA29_9LAMI|nr:hypothetical protein RD792_008731 [Penstemon davidsonii]
MSYFSEMEWSSKWDWGNLVTFGSKAMESPKKLQFADWKIVDGEINSGSFNISGGGVNSGASVSDGGHGSSAKSSISASTDSSTFRFMTLEGSSGNFTKKMETKGTEVSGTSPPLETSIGSVEPWIGLKLEKRTYFENSGAGGNVKSTSLSLMPTPSTTTQKKRKGSAQNSPIPLCQVEGCNIDLSTAKEYHRKHRVCDSHSKCSKVIVGGIERRFCQQCSRFHGLSEFDEKKRSCRRRLSDHNARRRKPHQETIQFNSTRLSSPFYGGRQQMSFLLNNAPLVHSRTPANPTWDSTGNSKFTLTKYNGDGGTDEQLHMLGTKLPHAINTNGLSAFKSSTPELLSPGSKGGSLISSHLDAAAPEYRRALSLLSNNSWGSCGPESVPVHHPMAENDTNIMMHAIPEGVPLSCTDFWLSAQPSGHPRVQSLATNSNFQDFQLLKTPYEADFYSNM